MPTSKSKPVKAEVKAGHRVNDAEPAHSIIKKLGGVRALSRMLGLSAAAVTRWQTHRTDTDRRGCDGVIPEFRRADIVSVARGIKKRVTKNEFLKADWL